MSILAKLRKTIALTLGICLFALSAQAKSHWTAFARQVGQSEKTRVAALRELKQIKNLDKLLLKSLESPHKHLALDVIGALEMRDLIPELLLRIGADEDGFLTLTLNSLLNEET